MQMDGTEVFRKKELYFIVAKQQNQSLNARKKKHNLCQ